MKSTFPNPLEFFDVRKFDVPPPYLEYIATDFTYNLDDAIDAWIRRNCKGRYYVGRATGITSQDTVDNVLKIGFEDPKELSYFILACPHLKYK